MRIIVFFDLPVITSEEKKEYRSFRKFLLTNGFVMMQESVYSKIALNGTMVNTIKRRVKLNAPKSGLVQTIVITEKQYNSMEYIVGKSTSNVIDNDKRMIVL